MEFKVDQIYEVTDKCFYHGARDKDKSEMHNIIKITGIHDNCVLYETLKGTKPIQEYFEIGSIFSKHLRLVNQKIVITVDGTTTLARLYDGNKVVKTAEAKCNPSDEFNFETGASLAFERLYTKEEHKLKVGDKVRITGNTNHHEFNIGEIVTLKRNMSNGDWECYGKDKSGLFDTWFVRECDMEPVTFDWDAFEAGKICVKATKDNFKDFVAEAKKHGLTFKPNEKFNPFGDIYDSLVRLACTKLDVKDNEIYVIYEDDALRCSHYCESKEFVW